MSHCPSLLMPSIGVTENGEQQRKIRLTCTWSVNVQGFVGQPLCYSPIILRRDTTSPILLSLGAYHISALRHCLEILERKNVP
ncbi:hypothetical protein CEXT_136131 [Caerostris extrusa]|uniref:Uncharacterized protein n=1 Tax=Caerostris extrusa TaxID=172846 RepID=A0AAV4SLT6_CAEEX|nr:hypothetical protein CEXT_136131 [Caerostris extrusa]